MNDKERKKRKQWEADQMVRAYNAVKNKEMGYLKASQIFKVPKSTLERYCKSETHVAQLNSMKMGRKPTFSPDMEKELAEYALIMVSRFYGLRASDIRSLAFQLAIKNGLPHQFNMESKIAGRKWMRKFLKRNPNLSFRTPQATSANRAKGFSKVNVDQFNDILEAELTKINFDPTKIYNVDETGVTVVQHKMEKVLCLKGQKQVGGISSAERGALITLVTCMSASGFFVPPLFIFPRVNMKEELKNGAPPGSQFACHKSGWIQSHIFTQWIVHFINTVRPCKDSPVILILDGHFTHTRNIDVIDKCRENGVILICLPPHSSHRMQPLDVSFMSPFKTYYAKEIDTWLKNHPGRVVTAFQVAELVGKAYMRAATLEVAVNGFRKSGIFPFDRNHFRDHDFAVQDDDNVEKNTDFELANPPLPPTFDVHNEEDDDTSRHEEKSLVPVISQIASATESGVLLMTRSAEPAHLPLAPALIDTQTTPPSNSGAKKSPLLVLSSSRSAPSSLSFLSLTVLQSKVSRGLVVEPTPLSILPHTESPMLPSSTFNDELYDISVSSTLTGPQVTRGTRSLVSKFCVKPADISPLPKIQSKCKKPGQETQLRGGKPLLVTSSPYKNELQEQLIKNQAIPGTSKSKTKKLNKKNAKTTVRKTVKKKEKSAKENEKKSQKKKTNVKEKKKKKIAVKKKILQSSSSSEVDEDELLLMSSDESHTGEDAQCIYCLSEWSNDIAGEKWIRCTRCFRWCHELCAGVEPRTSVRITFCCDLCKD